MRYAAALVTPVLLVALAACGGDDGGSDEATDEPSSAAVETTSATVETETPAETPTVDLGDAEVVTLTSEEICAALPVDAASVALGTEVTLAEPAAGGTPQCSYTYGGDSSTMSTFTVAAQVPADLGGRGLQDAFDYVLDLNRGLAADTSVEEAEVAAGDRAVRLAGEALTLVVVASAGHLLTLITTPDVATPAVEALAVAAADAVA